MIPRSASEHYYREVERCLIGCSSVLDIGCGELSPLSHMSVEAPFVVGLDGHFKSLKASYARGIHHAYIMADLRLVGQLLRPESFDAVVALDVIEHLTKQDGLQLLDWLEMIACKRIILVTPSGFRSQQSSPDNPFQSHLSGWTASELTRLGYRVRGIRGLRITRRDFAIPTISPRRIGEAVSYATQPLARVRPSWAYQLIAIKDLLGAC